MAETAIESSRNGTTSKVALAIVLLVTMCVPTAGTWMSFYVLDDAPPLVQQLGYVVGKSVMLVPLLWFLFVERGRLRLVKFTGRGQFWGIVFGLGVSLGMFALYFGWLKATDIFAFAASAVEQRLVGFGVDRIGPYVLFGLFVSLLHSGLEEYYWRWFVFGRGRELMPVWPAAIIGSLAFTAHHVVILGKYFGWGSPAQILFSLGVTVGGVVWCLLYDRFRTLYSPWISHAIIDAAIFVVGYDLVFAG
ncbi:hypothetical protein JCM19992_09060 [Thermostilla marina]